MGVRYYYQDGVARVAVLRFTGRFRGIGFVEVEAIVPGVPRGSRRAWVRYDDLRSDTSANPQPEVI